MSNREKYAFFSGNCFSKSGNKAEHQKQLRNIELKRLFWQTVNT